VKAGLRFAKAQGKRLGRPPKDLDTRAVAALCRQGLSWRAIAKQLGIGVGTLYRVAPECSKIQQKVFGTQEEAQELLKGADEFGAALPPQHPQ